MQWAMLPGSKPGGRCREDQMSIELYEFTPTRSQRARWTLLELDVPFESIAGRELIEFVRSRVSGEGAGA